jgi:phosphoglycerate dehydrogenase-like enzyme
MANADGIRLVVQLGRERFDQLFDDEQAARLRRLAEVIGPFEGTEATRPSPALAGADVLFVPGGMHLSPDVLAAAPRLRWIADTSGGPPRLDYRLVQERGILVTDCRRAFGPAVAELALALYLAVMRDVVVHDRALHTPEGIEGVDKGRNREASGRTIGFVGYGGIARALQPLLAPFQPRLMVYDPFVEGDLIRAAGAEPVTLDELLQRCDAVFVLATPTVENRRLLGPAQLDLLRPESVLLVISRSWLVDEEALIERLRAGRFRAAMDVFEQEPLPAGHPYRSLANVVLTPHRAGGTVESYRRIGRGLAADLERYRRGEPPVENQPVTLTAARLQGRDAGV